jgi:acyl dehydratase
MGEPPVLSGAALAGWSYRRRHVVDPAAVRAYAAATDDPAPDHAGGTVAPPLFPAVWLADALPPLAAVLPGATLASVVHLRHGMVQRTALRAGQAVDVRVAVRAAAPTPAGVGLDLALSCHEDGATGAILHEQSLGLLVHGHRCDEPFGRPAPVAPAPAAGDGSPSRQTRWTIADDQTKRYAAVSGDENPLHLDDAAARAMGFPGVIVHGLCSLAMAAWALTPAGDRRRPLTRLSARFGGPVFPGDELVLQGWGDGPVGFVVRNGAGRRVLRSGRAEFAGPSRDG